MTQVCRQHHDIPARERLLIARIHLLFVILFQACLESAAELRMTHSTHLQRVKLLLNALLLLVSGLSYPPLLFSHYLIKHFGGLLR